MKQSYAVLICVLLLTIPVCAQNSPAPATKTPAQPVAPNPEMASWTEGTERFYGMTKDQFSYMGLSKLTTREFGALLLWAKQREINAEAAAVSQHTVSCGRSVTQPSDYDKVNVYLDIQDSTPSDLAARIRQNFRAIPDVQVVFTREDADLTVSIIGIETSDAVYHQGLGYAVSTAVTAPCTAVRGTSSAPFEMFENSHLNVGGRDVAVLAEKITTSIDAGEMEAQRRQNADFKKQTQPNK